MKKIILILCMLYVSPLFCQNKKTDVEIAYDIAYKYAPIIMTKHQADEDKITRIKGDRVDENANEPHVYFDISATTNFIAVSYMIYHGKDNNPSGYGHHVHDTESVVVFADKKGGLLFFSTNVHGMAMNSKGNSDKVGNISNLPDIDLDITKEAEKEKFNLFQLADGDAYKLHHKDTTPDKYIMDNRPLVFVTPGSHSIYRSSTDNINKDFDLYTPAADVNSNTGVDLSKGTKYKLILLSSIVVELGLQNQKELTLIPENEDLKNPQIFDKYFKKDFLSTQKGTIKWKKSDGSMGILPTHLAEGASEKEPEADLPMNFKNKNIYFMLNPVEFLKSIGFENEELKYSTYNMLPTFGTPAVQNAETPQATATNRGSSTAEDKPTLDAAWGLIKARLAGNKKIS